MSMHVIKYELELFLFSFYEFFRFFWVVIWIGFLCCLAKWNYVDVLS